MTMLLGGVHIPADVLTAWEEQRLVIFTGAGVSMSPPSSLPNFAGLAAEVASILQSLLDPEADEWKDQLDTFMDVMNEDDGVDVHRLVQGYRDKGGFGAEREPQRVGANRLEVLNAGHHYELRFAPRDRASRAP
jgi:hypothetical protein